MAGRGRPRAGSRFQQQLGLRGPVAAAKDAPKNYVRPDLTNVDSLMGSRKQIRGYPTVRA
jgi:hypothetical protein